MPLEEVEERVLRWMEREGRDFVSIVWGGEGVLSFLRPDVLFEEVVDEKGDTREHPLVCEINGRLPHLPHNGWGFNAVTCRAAMDVADLAPWG
jgi:hypothetical protein